MNSLSLSKKELCKKMEKISVKQIQKEVLRKNYFIYIFFTRHFRVLKNSSIDLSSQVSFFCVVQNKTLKPNILQLVVTKLYL